MEQWTPVVRICSGHQAGFPPAVVAPPTGGGGDSVGANGWGGTLTARQATNGPQTV
jgi:hypothetical protein